MIAPRETVSFVSPRPSMFPEAKPRGALRVEGKQNSLFPEGPDIKCFVIPPDSKLEKNCEKIICLTLLWLCLQYERQSNRAVLPKRHDNSTFLRS